MTSNEDREIERLRAENWRLGARLDGLTQLVIEMAKASNFQVTPQRFPLLWQTEVPQQERDRIGTNNRHSTNSSQPPAFSGQRGTVSNSSHNAQRGFEPSTRAVGRPHNPNPRIITFTYTADHDRKGVIYWLGTQKGNSQWQNPHNIGAVQVSGHLIKRGHPSMVVDHRFTDQVYYTEDSPEAFVTIDLKSVRVRPTTYTIAHRALVSKYYLRSWSLYGSVDGEQWEPICRHEDDTTLNNRRAVASFDVEQENFFSMFRFAIEPHGNSEQTSALVVSCFEIYGDVIDNGKSK